MTEMFTNISFLTVPTRNKVCSAETMYFAGIIVVSALIKIGMLEISKMNPDNINAGKKPLTIDICEAMN